VRRPSLYNIDAFTTEDLGIMVEDEDDCPAVFETGYRQVTTLANGSPPKISPSYDPATEDDDPYLPIRGNANPRVARIKRWILAGDMDEAGRRHHEEVARRLGKARCWVVTWPEGCKDAKDTLQKRGRDAVRYALEHAEPYPLEGIEVISDEAIARQYDGISERRYITGE
jgi:twinkle protein